MSHHHHNKEDVSAKGCNAQHDGTINDDGDDDDDDQKKAKTIATSSSPPVCPTTNSRDNALPPHLHLHSLPDIAHDAIASYLTNRDMHCMMECDQWLLKAYVGKIKSLAMPSIKGKDPLSPTLSATMLSLLSRRTGLSHVITSMDLRGEMLVEAMRRGYLNKLRGLNVFDVSDTKQKTISIGALCDALADGLCPKINALMVASNGLLLSSLKAALRSRIEEGKGCCGLKLLQIVGQQLMDLSILSSGACEALEELNMNSIISLSSEAGKDFSEWLLRTKAPNLQILKLPCVSPIVMAALCSPDVAPRLQTLHVTVNDATSISFLTQAIGREAWPNLSEMNIRLLEGITSVAENQAVQQMVPVLMDAIGQGVQQMVPVLVDAIGQGAPKLKVLSFCESYNLFGPDGGVAVARMLRDGLRLEKLDLSDSSLGDDGVVELARALEGGAPCNSTLRRLNLSCNEVGMTGVRALVEAMVGGALPYLECLSLSENPDIKDHGVVALGTALTTRRVLPCLQTLIMEDVGMTEIGAWVMFEAFRHHNPCPHLKAFLVGGNSEIGDGGVVPLARAIEVGAFQHLEDLDISGIAMTVEGFKALIKAMVAQQPNPGCPRLEVLDVHSNALGDEGVMHLAEAIKVKGAMQHLRRIDLYAVGADDVGAIALLNTLTQSHVCPNLEWMSIGQQYGDFAAEVESLAVAVQAIRRGLGIDLY